MKLIIILYLALVALCQAEDTSSPDGIFDININNQVDQYMDQFSQLIVQEGFDPSNLPDVTTKFKFKPGLITHHGTLYLTKGWFQDLRTVRRAANAYARTTTKLKIRVKIPLQFDNIEFGYDYKAKVMLTRPSGQILGNVKDIELYVQAVYNLKTRLIELEECSVKDMGVIKLKLTGSPLTDPWANAFIKVVTNIVHEEIVKQVDAAVAQIAQIIIDQINNR